MNKNLKCLLSMINILDTIMVYGLEAPCEALITSSFKYTMIT